MRKYILWIGGDETYAEQHEKEFLLWGLFEFSYCCNAVEACNKIKEWNNVAVVIIQTEATNDRLMEMTLSKEVAWIRRTSFSGKLFILMEDSKSMMDRAAKHLNKIGIKSSLILPDLLVPAKITRTILFLLRQDPTF